LLLLVHLILPVLFYKETPRSAVAYKEPSKHNPSLILCHATRRQHRRCHVDDPVHKSVRCVQDCDRVHRPCNHPCIKRCYQDCGKCLRIIKEPTRLPCGHEASGFECWR
jgi:hypothetical protein